jgi:electron transport complex protein RnfE
VRLWQYTVAACAADGLMTGSGFTFALVVLGTVREILSSGTLFAHAEALLGGSFAFLDITAIPDYKGFLLLILPPGGFMVLGFPLAGKRILDTRVQRKAVASIPDVESACAEGHA